MVVTIVILIILATISINTIFGKEGLIARVRLAKQISEVSNEKEAIQLAITLANMEKILDNSNKYYVGVQLYDKTLENGNKWNIMVENETQKIYGSSWNYIEAGTEIDNYGKTQYDWLVNYKDGSFKQIDKSKYTQLKYGSNLAVKDGLILNVDPINMSDSSSWGQNVKLYGVEDGDGYGYGWNGTEINFDGVNDYLEVYNNFEMNEGMTFEFYGRTYSDDKICMLSKTVIGDTVNYWTRFRTYISSNIYYCCMSGKDSKSDWKNGGSAAQWIRKEITNNFNRKEGSYLTMTVNLHTDEITLYQDGELVGSTKCSNEWLISGDITNNTIPFTIGYQISGQPATEAYSKMSLYSCRLYNKVLTDSEVRDNYNKTVVYHNMLLN